MILIDFLKHIREQWGLNKAITVIGLNICAVGITTCLAVNFIPDRPNTLEEKESK